MPARQPLKIQRGDRFTRLKFVRAIGKYRNSHHSKLLLICDCGKNVRTTKHDLMTNNVRSCGCLQRDKARQFLTGQKHSYKHGHASKGKHSGEYRAYHDAKSRCRNWKTKQFMDYGGRGIKFLFTSFEQFLMVLGPRPTGLTLDRRNNNGHYSPANCRWTDRHTQRLNQRARNQFNELPLAA